MGSIKEAGGDAALASGDALIRLQGPSYFAAEPEGPGLRARAGWWVMARACRGPGGTPYAGEWGNYGKRLYSACCMAGTILYSLDPHNSRSRMAVVLSSQMRTPRHREVERQAQGHAAGKWQSWDSGPGSLAGSGQRWQDGKGTEWGAMPWCDLGEATRPLWLWLSEL